MWNNKIVFAFAVSIFLILGVSFVSASAFGDFFKGIFGGKAGVTGNPIYEDFGSNLVSVYQFQENGYTGAAGEVRDLRGSNHGTAKNGVNLTLQGIDGKSGSFDGVNDYVSIPNSVNLGMNKDITLSAWFYSAQIPRPYAAIVTKSDGSENVWEMRFDYWDNKTQIVAKINGVYTQYGLSDIIQPNKWYHAVWTYDGSTAKLYLNGVQNSSISKSGEMSLGNYNVNIGARANGYNPWNGSIDEVMILNRSLSASEIYQLYQNQSARLVISGGSNPVNGVCGATLNSCNSGTFNDLPDGSTDYRWQCLGINGGVNANCIIERNVTSNQTCFDSNGGLNYYLKGNVTTNYGVFDDVCSQFGLFEKYCFANGTAGESSTLSSSATAQHTTQHRVSTAALSN